MKLEVGGATETVNVAAVAPLIDTATASVAGTVTDAADPDDAVGGT